MPDGEARVFEGDSDVLLDDDGDEEATTSAPAEEASEQSSDDGTADLVRVIFGKPDVPVRANCQLDREAEGIGKAELGNTPIRPGCVRWSIL